MRIVRAGLPALFGLFLVYIGLESASTAAQYNDASTAEAFRAGFLPGAIGAALLLAALAMARRTRLGYVAGLGVGALFTLGGVALIVIELGYVGQGGLTGSIAIGLIVFGAIWTLFWLMYTRAIRRARATFAEAWGPTDRRLGIALAALAIFGGAAWVALGAIDASTVATIEVDEAHAQELVNGTLIQVRVAGATFERAGDQARTVSHLSLDLTIQSSEQYTLVAAPTLCLTDQATRRDPAFKPDTYCWGSAGPAIALTDEFRDLTVPGFDRVVRIELDRGGALCDFAAGSWNAQIMLAPTLTSTGSVGPAPAQYTVDIPFVVESADAPPPSGTVDAGSCIDSTVSP